MNKKIIKEIVDNYLNLNLLSEYHHSYDAIYNDALNIGNLIIKYRKNGWDGNEPIKYVSNSFGNETRITIYLIDGEVNQYHIWNTLKISKSVVDRAIESNDKSKLLSAIYHELGHMTNVIKSNNISQIRTDFNVPYFFKLSQDEYIKMSKILYRFRQSEMKARCFETTMLLRQRPDMTLQEIYDNRCSDITMMQDFINYLKSNENSEKYNYIITELYKTLFNKIFTVNQVNIDKMKIRVIKYFTKKLLWFKKRIQKIYYDSKV